MSSIQKWRKVGRIFCPDGSISWMSSHAALPIAVQSEGDVFKVFFTSRDKFQRSHTGFLTLNLLRPESIIEISQDPVISPGALGHFDDSGTMGSFIVENYGQKYFYYLGWNLGVTVPFRNALGLAIDRGDGYFHRYAPGPVLDRSLFEPNSVGPCCVVRDGQIWRMWYASCLRWTTEREIPKHWYHIKYAESTDGINWERSGHVSIDFEDAEEYAFSRPSVLFHAGKWRMWYPYKGLQYRIGYAESKNGKTWIRMDNLVNLNVSETGWDSEMVGYPFVFPHNDQLFMLYNGNGYGETGFGLAVLED